MAPGAEAHPTFLHLLPLSEQQLPGGGAWTCVQAPWGWQAASLAVERREEGGAPRGSQL